jgi:hypothetical protein
MTVTHTQCHRFSSTEAIERLVDWVRNLDTDGLARVVSQHAPLWGNQIPVIVFDDCGGDDDSAPYFQGTRMQVVYMANIEPATNGMDS